MTSINLGNIDGIAVLDFSAFTNGSEVTKQEVATAMLDSFKKTGFVYLINHGIPKEKIDHMFEWVCLDFAIKPPVQKLKTISVEALLRSANGD